MLQLMRPKKTEADTYIRLLEWAKERDLYGFSHEEIFEFGHSVGYLTAEELNQIKVHLKGEGKYLPEETMAKYRVLNRIIEESFNNYRVNPNEVRCFLSLDSYFKLVEHTELVEARESAESARKYSLTAIGISVFAVAISVFVSIWASTRPTELTDHQIERIERLQFDSNSIESELGTIKNENVKMSKALQDISGDLSQFIKELEINKSKSP